MLFRHELITYVSMWKFLKVFEKPVHESKLNIFDTRQTPRTMEEMIPLVVLLLGPLFMVFPMNEPDNNNNIYRGSPTRQGGFHRGPRALI